MPRDGLRRAMNTLVDLGDLVCGGAADMDPAGDSPAWNALTAQIMVRGGRRALEPGIAEAYLAAWQYLAMGPDGPESDPVQDGEGLLDLVEGRVRCAAERLPARECFSRMRADPFV